MANIGTLSNFISWRGQFPPPRPTVDAFIRPGVAGTGAEVSASHGRPTEIETYFSGELSECIAHRAACTALIAQAVAATDAYGSSYAKAIVVSVSADIQRAAGLDAPATHLCHVMWSIIPEPA